LQDRHQCDTMTTIVAAIIMDLASRALCWIDPFVSICYMTFALIAIAVGVLQNSFLVDLVSHGKTRAAARKQRGGGGEQTAAVLQTLLLHDDLCLVPKKVCFLHFYIVGLVSLTVSSAVYYTTNSKRDRTTGMLVAVLFLHLSRRCQECLSVHNWSTSGSSRVHAAVYVVGMIHYILLPHVFIPPTSCSSSNDSGGDGETATRLQQDAVGEQPPPTILACTWLAAFICLWAQYQQRRHHFILANLRSDKKKQLKTAYRLPIGGWFQFVSCPHYLAEIIIYLALIAMAVLGSGGSSRGNKNLDNIIHDSGSSSNCYIYLLAWVIANLTVSGLHNQAWYRQNISNFDQLHRKAIFPFIL
jgi:3-oxo-5-alpha-steroid 4-dehydrogenase